MLKHFSTIILFFLSLIVFSCGQPSGENRETNFSFNRDSLAKHIIILASDSFQGRKPFTIGETRTVDYLQNQFVSVGLEPANGKSYFQKVPMVEISLQPDSLMSVKTSRGNFILRRSADYVFSTEKTDSLITLRNDVIIFAGYGVVAPEYNWNDYAGIDVKGKVVLVMVNDPGFGTSDTSIFKGRSMTYYGCWTLQI